MILDLIFTFLVIHYGKDPITDSHMSLRRSTKRTLLFFRLSYELNFSFVIADTDFAVATALFIVCSITRK